MRFHNRKECRRKKETRWTLQRGREARAGGKGVDITKPSKETEREKKIIGSEGEARLCNLNKGKYLLLIGNCTAVA